MKKIFRTCLFFICAALSPTKQAEAQCIYQIYLEDWNYHACASGFACASCWPACHFAWSPETHCNIAFASYGYNTNNPNSGIFYGLSQPIVVLQATRDLVHQAGGKIKMAYGGATSAWQFWNVAGYPSSSVLFAMAQNISSACVGNQLDGVDFDFEGAGNPGGPPAGSGAALASIIKSVRQLMPSKIITLTIPAQVLGNTGWPEATEFNSVVQNLLLSDGTLGYIDCINFMEYCMGYSKSSPTMSAQVITDMEGYHTGPFKLPYNKMALGMQQFCCSGSTQNCSTPETPLSPTIATGLTQWANNNGLYGVFFWDLYQEGQFYTPSLCSDPSAISQAFPVSYAIKYVCTQPPSLSDPQPALRVLPAPVGTGSSSPFQMTNVVGRANATSGQDPANADQPQQN